MVVYDGDGTEIPAVTVGQSLADGYRTVMAYCDGHASGHSAEVPLEGGLFLCLCPTWP
jgi:prepilin-type processing-associated H-X9-DG protein